MDSSDVQMVRFEPFRLFEWTTGRAAVAADDDISHLPKGPSSSILSIGKISSSSLWSPIQQVNAAVVGMLNRMPSGLPPF